MKKLSNLILNLPSSSDGESDLGLSRNEEISSGFSLSQRLDGVSLLSVVLIVILFSVGEERLSLLSSILLLLGSSVLELLQQLSISGLLLLHVLRHDSTHMGKQG